MSHIFCLFGSFHGQENKYKTGLNWKFYNGRAVGSPAQKKKNTLLLEVMTIIWAKYNAAT